jgi:hypothetical protein
VKVGNTFYSILFLDNYGNVGIGKKNPTAKLDVAGLLKATSANITGNTTVNTLNIQGNITGTLTVNDGIRKLSIGDAYGQNLGYGTSYIGFNATRNSTTGNWTCAGDGANNGGSVIWSAVGGDIYFASIPSTGINNKTLTDAQVKSNIKLHLNATGVLKAKEVSVNVNGWPDFVFEQEYSIMSLKETEDFIKENKHLPNIPTASEVEENGILLGEMQSKLLQKIEELTLYLIEQQKHSTEQQKLIEDLQKRLSELEIKKGEE